MGQWASAQRSKCEKLRSAGVPVAIIRPSPEQTAAGALAASGGVKQLRWRASVPKPPDAEPKPPAFAFAVQMLPCHLVCGFVGICGRDEPSVLLLPAATAAKLDLVYVHDAKMLLFYTLLLSQ